MSIQSLLCKQTDPLKTLSKFIKKEENKIPKTLKPLKKKQFICFQKQNKTSMAGGRFRELLKKYGKVAAGVHFSVSAASITGLYIAIKNNVDVESLLDKWHLPGISPPKDSDQPTPTHQQETKSEIGFVIEENEHDKATAVVVEKKRNRTAELAASSGGALTLAVLCNKALFPIRVPITIALTPPVARFLARRRIIKNSV